MPVVVVNEEPDAETIAVRAEVVIAERLSVPLLPPAPAPPAPVPEADDPVPVAVALPEPEPEPEPEPVAVRALAPDAPDELEPRAFAQY